MHKVNDCGYHERWQMAREALAYALLLALVLAAVTMWLMSARYRHYERRLQRGHRRDQPVRKPFWLK